MRTDTGKHRLNIDFDSIPYGTDTDVAIGYKYGCSATTIQAERKKRGIKPFGNTYSKKNRKHGLPSRSERLRMVKQSREPCTVPGCQKFRCVDKGLKNKDGLCRDHLLPDDMEELRSIHLSGWGTSMLGRAIGD